MSRPPPRVKRTDTRFTYLTLVRSHMRDIRPLVRLNVSLVLADGDRMEAGYQGGGGRCDYLRFFDPAAWRAQVDEAFRQALVRSEEHTSELQSLMRISYAVFCLT